MNGWGRMVKVLLWCGVVTAVLWMGADVVAALRYPGYSYTGQTISELSAIGAPTRSFLMVAVLIYSVLTVAFGVGVWLAAAGKRGLRIAGALLVTYGLINVAIGVINLAALPFATMHVRGEIGGQGSMQTDAMHLVLGVVSVLLMVLIPVFGAKADGKWFRIFSYVAVAVFVVADVMTFMAAPRIAANLPTPYAGLWERTMAYGYMIWMLLLAVVLLREQGAREAVARHGGATGVTHARA